VKVITLDTDKFASGFVQCETIVFLLTLLSSTSEFCSNFTLCEH